MKILFLILGFFGVLFFSDWSQIDTILTSGESSIKPTKGVLAANDLVEDKIVESDGAEVVLVMDEEVVPA
jgi:hypothetical protein